MSRRRPSASGGSFSAAPPPTRTRPPDSKLLTYTYLWAELRSSYSSYNHLLFWMISISSFTISCRSCSSQRVHQSGCFHKQLASTCPAAGGFARCADKRVALFNKFLALFCPLCAFINLSFLTTYDTISGLSLIYWLTISSVMFVVLGLERWGLMMKLTARTQLYK